MTWKPIAGAIVIAALFLPVKAEALDTNELLALVAMPLAVAAVSEVTDVPMSDLIDVVTLLNDANVPPVQFVEVVRYAPVALVVEVPTRTPFVEFVRTRYQAGILGTPLVTEIEREIRFYGVPDIELDIVRPALLVERDVDFIPAPVRTRVVEYRRNHPHGGPPGQLKKQLGLQTGAEVVHRDRTGNVDRDDRDTPQAKPQKAPKPAKVAKAAKQQKIEKHENRNDDRGDDDRGKGKDKGKGNDGGNGKGKGKGKG